MVIMALSLRYTIYPLLLKDIKSTNGDSITINIICDDCKLGIVHVMLRVMGTISSVTDEGINTL